ncbi:7-carboxy-7-deazaguanine synthase [Thiosulfatimonas sediminis]|uniref:7-carboxy-7-deazaguanine synthase n=1 Tax=Thiosulfatimonas sediminis TaxID=2675054 RepID=A0A6F8PW96_9GAMM|nr:7-carboxy-7-deazaguanine synthase [Thiosulfatimonas sediminis]BBP46389.1 7-carboxy-7-deazaguanine synthase [Thiosulfatimonas sediminis]
MSYSIKEVFFSLQGEGFHAGRPAIFCRFSNCNLWTGREEDRAKAVCQFCDTDFIGTDGQNGGRFKTPKALVTHLLQFWPSKDVHPFVILTGGEPLLQVDSALIEALHAVHFEIALETNGTKVAPDGIDWICMSPKANTDILLTKGDELKLVYPQPMLMPHQVEHLEFAYFYLQPMADTNTNLNQQHTQMALDYCLKHPQWNLSLQTHKFLGID